jgi:hypothetical protein
MDVLGLDGKMQTPRLNVLTDRMQAVHDEPRILLAMMPCSASMTAWAMTPLYVLRGRGGYRSDGGVELFRQLIRVLFKAARPSFI